MTWIGKSSHNANYPLSVRAASLPDLWPGQNLLGFTLMMVRDELSKE